MRICHVVLGCMMVSAAVASLAAQTPVLGSIQAPYPAIQSSVILAGISYGAGAVAYGPAGTPLVLSGSDLGSSGTVQFVGYKNGIVVTMQTTASLWTPTLVFVQVPVDAVSGPVTVTTGGKTSNALPFVVTRGSYSASCPALPATNQLQIVTSALSDGLVGQSYSATLSATGGTQPYTWSITGSLPSGLSLNASTGVISGTPTSAYGPADLTLQITDSGSPQLTSEAVLSLTVGATGSGSGTLAIYSYSIPSSGYDAAGNVLSYTDSVNGTWSMSGGYDTLNRLTSASATSGPYQGLQAGWSYDSFGNRTAENFSGTLTAQNQPPIPGSSSFTYNAKNQVQTAVGTAVPAYDAGGNVVQDGQNQYAYDAAGRICAVYGLGGQATQYLYDASGNRVAKGTIHTVNGALSCDTTQNGFTLTESYILGPNGEQLTELSWNGGTAQWAHTNVWAGGQLVATYSADPDTSQGVVGILSFHLTDWLGTRRVLTDWAGNPQETCNSLPYGSGQTCMPTPTEHLFTAKERDQESGNDYFGARYYGSSMGRFLSPDPGWFFATNPANPQTWNLYSYVLNNPLAAVDPDGYDCVYLNNAGTDVDRDANGNPTGIDQNSNSGECNQNGGKWVDGTVTNVYLSSTSNDVYLTGQAADGSQTNSGTNYISGGSTSVTVAAGYDSGIGPNAVPIDVIFGQVGNGDFNTELMKPIDPWTERLFETHWCGPGGAGPTINALDAACKAHDACYGAAGISAANNTGGAGMTLQQASAASACNQALYNAASANSRLPGASRVMMWLKYGDKLSVLTGGMHSNVLAPGTGMPQ